MKDKEDLFDARLKKLREARFESKRKREERDEYTDRKAKRKQRHTS